jgi:hypothetical protein
MPAERDAAPTAASSGVFRAATLPRWRAIFAIVCAAAAFLCAGGALEYGTGSPETRASPAAGYWAVAFAVNVAAFGGAGLIAAFPGLARRPVKLAWLAVTVGLYGLAFATWLGHQPGGGGQLIEWLRRSGVYVPAAVVTAVGLMLSSQPYSGAPPALPGSRPGGG